MQFYLDSQPGSIKLKPDQSGDPWPNGTPRRQVDVCGSQTVPDILVDANMERGGNPVPKPAPSELAEHLTSVEHSLWQKDPKENGGGNPVPKPAPSELAEHLTSVEHSLRSKYPIEDEGGDPVPKPAPSGLAERSTSVENSPGPIYPMPDDKPGRRVCFYDSQTVSKLLVDFGADGGGNPVPKPAQSELAQNSTSVENSLRPLQAGPMEHPSDTPRRVVRVSDNQPVSEPRQSENQKIRKQPVSELSVRGRHHRKQTESLGRHPLLCHCRLGVTTVGGPNMDGGAGEHGETCRGFLTPYISPHLQQHTPETHDHQKNVCSDLYPNSRFGSLSSR